ncbi:MAG: NUDIX hydrolase [Jatrophihabitans sp.]
MIRDEPLGLIDRPTAPSSPLASVGWVHTSGGRLLSVRARDRDRFSLPGGKLEPDETPEQALVREVGEELGMTLTELRPAFTVRTSDHGTDLLTELTMYCYYGVATGHARPARAIAELAWLSEHDTDRAAPALQLVLGRLAGDRAGARPA